MALPDFPNNPTLNEQFTVGTNIYRWDGEKWKALSNADNSLRSQLADVDSTVLVGGVEAKDLVDREVNALDFGVVFDGLTPSASQVQAAINSGAKHIVFPSGDVLLESPITINTGIGITFNNTRFLKNFDGVGITFANGSATVDLFGRGEIVGNGSFSTDGTSASTSPNAHGVVFSNSRVRIHGALWSYFHQGHGVVFDASVAGNANKSDFNELRATNNAGHGIFCIGDTDDQSVWRVGFYCQNNYLNGIKTSDIYSGRDWQGFIYCENNGQDGVSDEVNFGKLRSCVLEIYAEAGGGNEVVLGQNVSTCQITSYRYNLDQDNSSSQDNAWKRGAITYNEGIAGGARNGFAGGFRFKRARANQAGEGVRVPLSGGNFTAGYLSAINSSFGGNNPTVSLDDSDLSSRVRIGKDEIDVTSDSIPFLSYTGTTFSVGSTDVTKPTKVNVFGNVSITGGLGDPEGVVVASAGSLFLRNNGGAGTTLYVKESGSGSTGWVAK